MSTVFLRRRLHAAVCSFVLSSPLAAQTIVVTGVREPLALESVAGDVVLIDAETIRDSTADSIADLLRREAGLQLSRSGGPGHASGLLVRGAFSGQTVVLVDGVRIGSATLGQPTLESLSLSQIDHIEVLRGPGSSLYGADAIGGVVQVFTRRGEPGWRVDAQASAGGYGSATASAGVRGRVGDWDLSASAAHERSDGVSVLRPSADSPYYAPYNPDADGYRLASVQAQIGFNPAPGQRFGLTLLRSRQNAQFDGVAYAPPDYTPDNTPDFRDLTRTAISALDWRGSFAGGWVASAKLARSVDDLISGAVQTDRFRTTRDLLSLQLTTPAGALGRWTGAVEQGRDLAQSTSFADDVRRSNTALVLALTGEAGVWSWQADLRRDDPSDFDAVTTARVGAALRFAPGWRLRALAGSTFRAPSFNDLYFPDYGVAGLRPERGRSVEFGLDWRETQREVAISVFRNRVRELIGYQSDAGLCPADPAQDYSYGCAQNINRARLDGATLSGRQRLGALSLKAQFDFLNARDEASGQRLPRRAAHQETLAADWDAGVWRAGASLLRLGERPDGGRRLAAETTLDLDASLRLAAHWTLLARLLNATNRDTEPVRDYQGLGRQAWLGLRYEGAL